MSAIEIKRQLSVSRTLREISTRKFNKRRTINSPSQLSSSTLQPPPPPGPASVPRVRLSRSESARTGGSAACESLSVSKYQRHIDVMILTNDCVRSNWSRGLLQTGTDIVCLFVCSAFDCLMHVLCRQSCRAACFGCSFYSVLGALCGLINARAPSLHYDLPFPVFRPRPHPSRPRSRQVCIMNLPGNSCISEHCSN